MFWPFLHRADPPTRAALFRVVHERWLTRMQVDRRPAPRIPLRRVDRGGFDALRDRPAGRARAERWWTLALERVEDA